MVFAVWLISLASSELLMVLLSSCVDRAHNVCFLGHSQGTDAHIYSTTACNPVQTVQYSKFTSHMTELAISLLLYLSITCEEEFCVINIVLS